MKKKAKSIASATAAIVFAAFILSSVIYYQYSIHAEKKDVETIKVAGTETEMSSSARTI